MIRVSRNKRKSLLKVISFVFAFFLWFYVISSTAVEIEKQVSLNYILPKGYSISNKAKNIVTYKLSGPRAIIDKIDGAKDSIDIDLRARFRKKKKKYSLSYLSYLKKFPFSVKILNVEPKKLNIVLEPTITKTFNIQAQTIFNLPEKLKLESIILSKKKVKVSGARKVLKRIDSVVTEALDLSLVSSSNRIELKLLSPDYRTVMDTEKVSADIELKSNEVEYLLEGVPIIYSSEKVIKQKSHKVVSLLIKAKKGLDATKLKKSITAQINAVNLEPGVHKLKLNIKLPDGASLIKSYREDIQVKIGK